MTRSSSARPHQNGRQDGYGFGPPPPSVVALQERVSGLERGIDNLANSTGAQFAQMRRENSDANAAIVAEVKLLASSLNESRRPQWTVLASFLGTFVLLAGFFGSAYINPIRENQTALSSIVTDLRAELVPRSEQQDRRQASADRMKRIEDDVEKIKNRFEAELKEMRGAIVPRGEHEEKWRGNDQKTADFQRQIDTLRTDFGGTYGLKDFVRDAQARLAQIERELKTVPVPPGR